MSYTSRSDFPAQLPSHWAKYCFNCHTENPETVEKNGRKFYDCQACKQTSDRFLTYDPKMITHFDEEDRLVHEGCGVIPVRSDGKLLLYERLKFPFLLTIPAGHMEVGEVAEDCASREMFEEIGIKPRTLKLAFQGAIVGDSCVGGADVHYWHAYVTLVDDNVAPIMGGDEGVKWGWYSPDELNEGNTVQPLLILLSEPQVQQSLSKLV